ncbi:hypothetical protein TIFTF001_038821 [Ficus carica]|uniref:Uncharacterized protein n=1 Tax=Ficus carica TaxID=3494 RepID=A0AA88JEA7_FICCA|nr:hypothetical protein TIFTF001_038821 [Ficus carica]
MAGREAGSGLSASGVDRRGQSPAVGRSPATEKSLGGNDYVGKGCRIPMLSSRWSLDSRPYLGVSPDVWMVYMVVVEGEVGGGKSLLLRLPDPGGVHTSGVCLPRSGVIWELKKFGERKVTAHESPRGDVRLEELLTTSTWRDRSEDVLARRRCGDIWVPPGRTGSDALGSWDERNSRADW